MIFPMDMLDCMHTRRKKSIFLEDYFVTIISDNMLFRLLIFNDVKQFRKDLDDMKV